MDIVHLDRLTSREVGEWLKTNDVVFVPHGPISGHGPWTTLGMHPHAAEAIAVLLARKCGGLVALRSRGTRGFRYDAEREHSSHGTVGLTWQGQPDIELGVKILDALADYLLPAVDALKRHRDYLKAHPPRRIEKQVPLPP